MGRSVPGAISAKMGQGSFRLIWLVEWQLPGSPQYLSSGPSVNYNGNTYLANRVISISNLTAQYIDRKTRDFDSVTITLDNLADDGSSLFPYTALDGAVIFEDSLLKIHLYDIDAAAAVNSVWFGYSRRPKFDPAEKTVEVEASFLWDSQELVVPSKTQQQAGFGALESERTFDPADRETAIPLVYGVGPDLGIRPTIYQSRVENNQAHINFIISGTHSGLPFAANDLAAADVKLFKVTRADVVDFKTGSQSVADPNKARFPDGQVHSLVAHAYASFPITDQIKDKLDDIKAEDIKIKLANGRPLADTGLPSENPVLILKDLLRDPQHGLGLANAAFDAAVVTASANHAGARYQARLELREQTPLSDLAQQILSEFHGFLTFNNGLVQIGVKKNNEASVATFATVDSGFGGRTIHDDEVVAYEKDFSEIINQVNADYRRKGRNKRQVIMYDPNAQARAGGNIRKVVKEDRELLLLFDDTQVQINGAILLREEQNGNLFIEFASPLIEGLDVAPGDVITVRSPDIPNNASNNSFRVLRQTFDTGDEPIVRFFCQVYKAAVYDDTTAGIGVDLLRGSEDTGSQGRPPNVIPVSAQVVDVTPNDTDGRLATVRAVWTYPAVDLAGEQAEGIFREYPISAVQLWWRYTDESINEARLGTEVKHPTPQGDFQIDYKKNKSIEVFFVALGHNRSRAPLGYVPDPTKVTALTANLSATGATANVVDSAQFAVNDYVIIEKEIARVASKTGNTITFVTQAGNRQAFFDTSAIAHPSGTELSVARISYPSLTLPLTPPRLTYKTVSGFVARQRQDGVRCKWNDVDAENQEKYYLYWSTDADAGTNPNKLGISTPAWYLANPDAPPAGISLVKVDNLAHKILQEDLGGTGIDVYARVAARNGKHNWSQQLSVLGTNNASGSGGTPPTDPPSTPTLADIITNQVKTITSKADADVVFRVYADPGRSKTWAQTGANEVVLGILKAGATKTEHFPYVIDDLNATFVDVPQVLTLGLEAQWKYSMARNAAGKNKSPVVSVNFFAGGKVLSLAGITDLQITSVTPRPETNGRHSYVNFQFTQPNPPVLLERVFLFMKTPSETDFRREHKIGLLDEEPMQTPGLKSFPANTPCRILAKHGKSTNNQYQIRLTSPTDVILSPNFSQVSPEADSAAPNNGATLDAPTARLKRGGKLVGRFRIDYPQMETHTHNVVIIHDNNATGAGRRYWDPDSGTWVAAYGDGTTELKIGKAGHFNFPTKKKDIFVGGRTQFYVRVGIYNKFNTASATYSGDTAVAITQAAAEPDAQEEDAAAASAVQNLLLAWNPRKAYVTTWDRPASNIQSYRGAKVVYTDPGGTVFMRAEDKRSVATGTHSISAGLRTLTGSGSLYLSELAPGDEVIINGDYRVVESVSSNGSALVKSAFTFSASGGMVIIKRAGSRWPAGTTEAQAAIFVLGERHATRLRKADLNPAFVGGIQVKVTPVNLVNGVETDGTPTTSPVVPPGNDYLGQTDVIGGAAIGVAMTGKDNLFPNSDFVRSKASSLELRNWHLWNGVAPIGNNLTTISTTSPNVTWSKNAHAINVDASVSRKLVCSMGQRLMPGEYYTFVMLVKSVSGVLATGAGAISFLKAANAAANQVGGPDFSFKDVNSSGYQAIGTIIQMLSTGLDITDGGNYAEQYFVLDVVVAAGVTLVIDRFRLIPGQWPSAFSIRASEIEDGVAAGLIPAAITQPDSANPSANIGQWVRPGQSGRILPADLGLTV